MRRGRANSESWSSVGSSTAAWCLLATRRDVSPSVVLCAECPRRRRNAGKKGEGLELTAQINIANPATGAQKLIDIEDERKVRIFYDKRMSQEVAVGAFGDGRWAEFGPTLPNWAHDWTLADLQTPLVTSGRATSSASPVRYSRRWTRHGRDKRWEWRERAREHAWPPDFNLKL